MGLVDFDTLLYQPNHTVFGEDATLTLTDTGGSSYDLVMIDETAGVEVLDGPGIATVLPAATVRAALLVEMGIALASLPGAALRINGKDWTVVRHEYRPSPQGEAKGEIRMILEKAIDG
jgi:hypothetical protein